jgi:DNA (cytosine-5)-methyltransferase 1
MSRRLGSLFSGVGGFDLAAERVGMTVAWQSEIEPFANKVLAHRFPDVPNLGDVTQIESAPPVDIITAGFPCQDLSVAGKQAGLRGGNRSVLFFEILRIVEAMRAATHGRRPAWLVLENVPGLISSHRGRDFAAVLGGLRQLGPLDIAWRVLDARFFGVPQRRRRIFVVCDFAGERAAEILALTAGGAGHPPPRRAQGQGPANGAADGAGGAGAYTLHGFNSTAMTGNGEAEAAFPTDIARSLDTTGGFATYQGGTLVANCLTAPRTGGGGSYRLDDHEVGNLLVADLAQITSKRNRTRVEAGLPSSTLAAESQMIVANALTASNGHHGHSSPRGDGSDNLVPTYMIGLGSDPLHSRDLAQPLTNRHGDPGTISGEGGVRRLTPVEAERLQGFPDGWTCLHDHPQPCECSDGARYRVMGNAVCVAVSTWILGRIARLETP